MRWSVVIPAYMPGDNLAVTLASVVTAMGDRDDFEVIVVDDASPEPIEIADYGPRVRVERMDDNVGAVPNFNRSVALATGDYIHVLHADDYVAPEFYAGAERGLDLPDVAAAACRVHRVDGDGSLISTMKPELATAGIWANAFERLAVSNRIPAVSVVAKRSVYDAIGAFDESLVHAADWDMWIRFARAGHIFYDPAPLAFYRVHEAQHTASVMMSATNIDEAIDVIKRLPSRASTSEVDRLMARAYMYRALYAARTAARSVRAGRVATSRNQLVAGLRCVVLGVGSAFAAVRRSVADPSA